MNKEEYNYYRIPTGKKLERVQALDEDGLTWKLEEVNIDKIIEQSHKELVVEIEKRRIEAGEGRRKSTGSYSRTLYGNREEVFEEVLSLIHTNNTSNE